MLSFNKDLLIWKCAREEKTLIAMKQILGWSDAIGNTERMTKEYQRGSRDTEIPLQGIFQAVFMLVPGLFNTSQPVELY